MNRKIEISYVIAVLSCVALLYVVPTICFGQSKYGVIACSRGCRFWGTSNNCDSLDEAIAKAIADCEKSGKKCKKLRHVHDACHALATASNGAWGHDWAYEQKEAEQKALDRCRKSEGKDCTIRCSTCTDW